MMTRVFEKDAEYIGTALHAIKAFAKRYPEQMDGFEETFEWMAETGCESFNDCRMADGSRNDAWSYSLNLEWIDGYGICKDAWYISLVLRDER